MNEFVQTSTADNAERFKVVVCPTNAIDAIQGTKLENHAILDRNAILHHDFNSSIKGIGMFSSSFPIHTITNEIH